MSGLLNRDQVKEIVHVKCQLGIMNNMIEFVKAQYHEHNFWGAFGDDFIRDLCYLLIYRMITGSGVDKLEHTVRLDPEHKLNHGTVLHNLEIILPLLEKWSYTKIVAGTVEEWNIAVSGEHFPHPFEPVNLWMDSSDFPCQDTVENKDWYSHKLKGIGIRVQFITDGRGVIHYIKGPLQPGQFDSFFLELFHHDIEELFSEAHIIADNHYMIGTTLFTKGPTFYVNKRETTTDKAVGDDENIEVHLPHKKRRKDIDVSTLTEGQKEMARNKLLLNLDHSHVRGRCEGVFSHMKSKFKILSERHVDSVGILYKYVVIATAINNMTIHLSSSLP